MGNGASMGEGDDEFYEQAIAPKRSPVDMAGKNLRCANTQVVAGQ